MLKDYAIIAIIDMEEVKNLGTVNTKFYTQLECVKIVILTSITK